jgi:glycosyltransferase involved in cell wall biosynthesis
MTATETILLQPTVSVIIPARNEEASLGACLESLVSQTGVSFEIVVVDDHSTDHTREIAESFAADRGGDADAEPRTPSSGGARNASAVRVIEADPLPEHWTGKNNAVATGARAARGEWLLFTDADTVHLPGSLARALAEAKEHNADMLSYSPEQIAVSFWEMAILPVVFAELARQYPPSKVSDPNSPIAAANGQYILIRREAYDAVGGHAAIASEILEDVALARAVKASGRKIRFRYAADAVRTRMYRNFSQLREGWTKNLALLFPSPGWLAVESLFWWVFPWSMLFLSAADPRHWWWFAAGILIFSRNAARMRRANFDLTMEFLGAFFGMPMFAYLLLRSKRAHGKGSVSWKGRTYAGEPRNEKKEPIQAKISHHSPKAAQRLS